MKTYKLFFYDTFWIFQGLEEYQKIYGTSFFKDITDLGVIEISEIKALIASKMKGSIRHYGEPHLNKATVAGILRMIYKELKVSSL